MSFTFKTWKDFVFKDMEQQLNTVVEESLKFSFKVHKGKKTFLTNIDTTDSLQINRTEVEKL